MGIYDREYIRRDRPSAGAARRSPLGSVRFWSANTWLIVLCVAVFGIDRFTPACFVSSGRVVLPNWPPGQGPPETWVAVGAPVEIPGRGVYGRTVLERPGGNAIGWLEGTRMPALQAGLHFSTNRGFRRVEFWRFVGFQFLHANLVHLLFNMVALYFFGPLVEENLGRKRYAAFFLLCGICAALLYVLLNLAGLAAHEITGRHTRVPGLLFEDPTTPLIGASGGVFGVLMAGAFLAPRAKALFWFVIPIELRTLAYLLTGLAFLVLFTGGPNAGGEAGHLGGAIAGAYLIRHPHHLHGFFDLLGRVDPTSHHYRLRSRAPGGRGNPREVDRILRKINESGLQSLTEREKRTLREASER